MNPLAEMLLLGCIVSAWALCPLDTAPGPEWLAEVSEPSPPHRSELTIVLPEGEYTTVGIYGSNGEPAPKPTDGIEFRTFVQHCMDRRVDADTPQERRELIPEFMIPSKWHQPDGLWAIQFHALKRGIYEIPIQCTYRGLTLTLDVRPHIPDPDMGFGLYGNRQNWPDIEQWQAYLRDQREHRMNTTTIASGRPLPKVALDAGLSDQNGADVISWHLDAAAKEGLLDLRFPIHCYTQGNEDVLDEARAKARNDWPELLTDVLPHEAAPGAWQQVKACYEKQTHRYRAAHDSNGDAYLAYGDWVDVPIFEVSTLSRRTVRQVEADGKEWWAYNCNLRGTNGPMNRYSTGLWAWAVRPRVLLHWVYIHHGWAQIDEDGTWRESHYHDRALSTPDGPVPSVGFEGLRDGIVDYMALRQVERLIERDPRTPAAIEATRWLASLEKNVNWRWDRSQRGAYYWDIEDLELPPISSFTEMRAQAFEFISRMEAR